MPPPARDRSARGRQLVKNLLFETCTWKSFAKAVLAEYVFTAAFIFLATAIVTSGCHTRDTAAASGAGGDTALTNVVPGSCFIGNTTNILTIAFGFGYSIFVLVYAASSFSGGHLNPAVTIAFLLTGKISIIRALFYIAFQLGGACTGSALVLACDKTGFKAALGAANHLNTANGVSEAAAWGFETILTFIFVMVIFVATDAQRSSTAHIPVLAPLAIGTTLFLIHLVAIPVDGCSVNPARSFGTSAVSHEWADHWIFWVGPIGGAIIAAAVYEGLFRSHESEMLVLHPEHDVEAPGKGKAALQPYAGVQGTQERSRLQEQGCESTSGSDSTSNHGKSTLSPYSGVQGLQTRCRPQEQQGNDNVSNGEWV
ncbi:hypothetical protein WJX72_003829 [[Myrmecia] bisecta]|uniref:Aquaporin n=1 Tax=[Myrmecia] bisecta TaxID=41462 RepID=A0AAW1Q1H4_9CHLO